MWTEKTPKGKVKYVERYIDYITGKEKKVSITFEKDTAANRKEAARNLNKRIDDICSQSNFVDMTLKQLVERYRKHQLLTVRKSTYTRNFHACNSLMNILGKDILLSRITAPYVKDCFLATKKNGITLNEHRTRFKALMNFAFEEDILQDVSFLKKLKPFHEKVSKKMRIQDKFLESYEAQKLLEQMESEGKYVWAYLTHIMILSGFRSGEIIGLKNSKVDLKNRYINVKDSYDPINKVLSDGVKTESSERETYIQDDLLVLLKKTKTYVKEERFRYRYKNEHDLFLPSAAGQHLSYFAFNKYLKAAATRAGIKKIVTTHVLRHTHCSLMFEQGVDLDIISRRMGHADSVITKEIYLHITEKIKERDNQAVKSVHLI